MWAENRHGSETVYFLSEGSGATGFNGMGGLANWTRCWEGLAGVCCVPSEKIRLWRVFQLVTLG